MIKSKKTVEFGAGVTFFDLMNEVKANNKALHDVTSYPHINVMGAILTGSHGGGPAKGNFASYVTAFELITAKGEIITKTIKDKDFKDYLFSFGNIGIFTKMEMKIRDDFDLKRCYYSHMEWDHHFSEEMYDSVNSKFSYLSFYTNWEERAWSQIIGMT